MAASNSESKNIQFYKLKGKADADTTPAFWKSEKVDGKWTSTDSFDSISGVLTKAEIKTGTYQGKDFKTFHIELSDPGLVSGIDMTHNQCTYGILNALACIEPGQEIKISVYKKTDKVSNKIYPGATIRNTANEMIKWSVQPKDTPRAKKIIDAATGLPVMVKGAPVFDDTAVIAFWETHFLTEVATKVRGSAQFPVGPPREEMPPATADDLPF